MPYKSALLNIKKNIFTDAPLNKILVLNTIKIFTCVNFKKPRFALRSKQNFENTRSNFETKIYGQFMFIIINQRNLIININLIKAKTIN